MPQSDVSKITRDKSHLARQVAPRPEKEVDAPGAASFKPDVMGQVVCRLGDASCAGAHASRLSRVAVAQPVHDAVSLLNLQRSYGNRYVQRVVALARQADSEGEVAPEVEDAIQAARSSGQALDSGVRARMKPVFGVDFNGVRVHTGDQADTLNHRLNARAFTTGQDIFFRQGEYNPGSSSGRELLAHELTHVVQQTGSIRSRLTIGQPSDPYEQEAAELARAFMRQEGQLGKTAGGRARVQTQTENVQIRRDLSQDYDTIRDDLSYGFLDWAIRDYEARDALRLLEGLSDRDLIDTYYQMEADGIWGRLISNIPDDERAALATLQGRIQRLTAITELTPADQELIRDICLFFFPDNPPGAINNELAEVAMQMVAWAKGHCSELMDIIPHPPSNPGLFWLLRQVGGPLWRRVRREGRIYWACRNAAAYHFSGPYRVARQSSEFTSGRGVR